MMHRTPWYIDSLFLLAGVECFLEWLDTTFRTAAGVWVAWSMGMCWVYIKHENGILTTA